MTSYLDNPSVARVQQALADAGSSARVVEFDESARTAADAAAQLGVALGAIVKSLVFTIDGNPVMALIAGDQRCDVVALARAQGSSAPAERADADAVRAATGFAIGGVAPLGHAAPLPVFIDASLARFTTVYAAAGHPHCVFPTSVEELARLTGGTVSEGISREIGG